MTAAPAPKPRALETLAARVLPDVEHDIEVRLDAVRARVVAPDARAVVEALRSLATRGGKRVRATLVCAGHAAFGGDPRDVVAAAAGVEILHAYLLAHDDWMDKDDVRRGGPSVHAELRERFGDERQGAVGAILAGDLGSAIALEAIASVMLPAERVLAAVRELATFHTDVVLGQMLDVRNVSSDPAAVETMHELKTASYTVRGPLRMGARLAGESDVSAIDAFATPLGIAFQLQDDILGAFGDPRVTGKPRGSDLREGKRTALVVLAQNDRSVAPLLDRVLGIEDAPKEEVDALLLRMEKNGIRSKVEERTRDLFSRARKALDAFDGNARVLFEDAIDLLAGRKS